MQGISTLRRYCENRIIKNIVLKKVHVFLCVLQKEVKRSLQLYHFTIILIIISPNYLYLNYHIPNFLNTKRCYTPSLPAVTKHTTFWVLRYYGLNPHFYVRILIAPCVMSLKKTNKVEILFQNKQALVPLPKPFHII